MKYHQLKFDSWESEQNYILSHWPTKKYNLSSIITQLKTIIDNMEKLVEYNINQSVKE